MAVHYGITSEWDGHFVKFRYVCDSSLDNNPKKLRVITERQIKDAVGSSKYYKVTDETMTQTTSLPNNLIDTHVTGTDRALMESQLNYSYTYYEPVLSGTLSDRSQFRGHFNNARHKVRMLELGGETAIFDPTNWSTNEESMKDLGDPKNSIYINKILEDGSSGVVKLEIVVTLSVGDQYAGDYDLSELSNLRIEWFNGDTDYISGEEIKTTGVPSGYSVSLIEETPPYYGYDRKTYKIETIKEFSENYNGNVPGIRVIRTPDNDRSVNHYVGYDYELFDQLYFDETVFEPVIPEGSPTITNEEAGQVNTTSLDCYASATVHDPNDDVEKAVVSWGDGSSDSTYYWTGDGSGGTFGRNHTYASSGNYTVTITAYDHNGNTDVKHISLTVNPIAPSNTAPTISIVATQPDPVDTIVNLKVTTNDSENNIDRVEIDWHDGSVDTEYLSPSGSTNHYAHTYGAIGSQYMDVTIYDDEGLSSTASTSITLTYTPGNALPTISPISNQATTVGSTISVTANGSDPNGDTLTYSVSGVGNINSSTGEWSWTPGATGSYNVTITVDDGHGGTASTSFTVNVNSATNNPPTISSISDKTTTVGDPVSEFVIANDPEGDSLTYGCTGGNISLNGYWDWTPSNTGTYPVTINVYDSNGNSASESFIVTVESGISDELGGIWQSKLSTKTTFKYPENNKGVIESDIDPSVFSDYNVDSIEFYYEITDHYGNIVESNTEESPGTYFSKNLYNLPYNGAVETKCRVKNNTGAVSSYGYTTYAPIKGNYNIENVSGNITVSENETTRIINVSIENNIKNKGVPKQEIFLRISGVGYTETKSSVDNNNTAVNFVIDNYPPDTQLTFKGYYKNYEKENSSSLFSENNFDTKTITTAEKFLEDLTQDEIDDSINLKISHSDIDPSINVDWDYIDIANSYKIKYKDKDGNEYFETTSSNSKILTTGIDYNDIVEVSIQAIGETSSLYTTPKTDNTIPKNTNYIDILNRGTGTVVIKVQSPNINIGEISNYKIRYPNGSVSTKTFITNNEYNEISISGLTIGEKYRFDVKPINNYNLESANWVTTDEITSETNLSDVNPDIYFGLQSTSFTDKLGVKKTWGNKISVDKYKLKLYKNDVFVGEKETTNMEFDVDSSQSVVDVEHNDVIGASIKGFNSFSESSYSSIKESPTIPAISTIAGVENLGPNEINLLIKDIGQTKKIKEFEIIINEKNTGDEVLNTTKTYNKNNKIYINGLEPATFYLAKVKPINEYDLEALDFSEQYEFQTQIPIELYNVYQSIEDSGPEKIGIIIEMNAPNCIIEGFLGSEKQNSDFEVLKNQTDDAKYLLTIYNLEDWTEYTNVNVDIYGNSLYIPEKNLNLNKSFRTDKYSDFGISSNINTLALDNKLQHTITNNHGYEYVATTYSNGIIQPEEIEKTQKIDNVVRNETTGYSREIGPEVIYKKENWFNFYGNEDFKYIVEFSTEGLTTKKKRFLLQPDLENGGHEFPNVIDTYPKITECFFNTDGLLTFGLEQMAENNIFLKFYGMDEYTLDPKITFIGEEYYKGEDLGQYITAISLDSKKIVYDEVITVSYDVDKEYIENLFHNYVGFDPMSITTNGKLINEFLLPERNVFFGDIKHIKNIFYEDINFENLSYGSDTVEYKIPEEYEMEIFKIYNMIKQDTKEILGEYEIIKPKTIKFAERPNTGIYDTKLKLENRFHSLIGPLTKEINTGLSDNEIVLALYSGIVSFDIYTRIAPQSISEEKAYITINDKKRAFDLYHKEFGHIRINVSKPIDQESITIDHKFSNVYVENHDRIKEETIETLFLKDNVYQTKFETVDIENDLFDVHRNFDIINQNNMNNLEIKIKQRNYVLNGDDLALSLEIYEAGVGTFSEQELEVTVEGANPNKPPVLNMETTKHLNVTLTGDISDDGGTIVEAIIDWGDGNTETINSDFENINKTHAYKNAGTYSITVTATDNDGIINNQELNIVVEDPNQEDPSDPIIDIGDDSDSGGNSSESEENKTPILNMSITSSSLDATLSGSIIDLDGKIYEAIIDWGDGSNDVITEEFGNIREVHSYNEEGTYAVKIIATDKKRINPLVYFNENDQFYVSENNSLRTHGIKFDHVYKLDYNGVIEDDLKIEMVAELIYKNSVVLFEDSEFLQPS